VNFRMSATPGNSEENTPKWDADQIHNRVEEIFRDGFPRVLAGEETDEGQDDRDQENEVRLIEGTIDDRPKHFLGLYRTADSEDIDGFIDAFVDNVVYDASWCVIEPHDCTHDRPEGGPCKVYDGDELEDKMVERGNVPESL